MENPEGKRVPEVTFHARKDGDWNHIKSSELFGGRKVIVFSLPGAFTPTCSTTHLPRYEELAPVFKENGIDEVVCLSVNDGFVMEAWAQDQGAENVSVIPDGNGEFVEGLGLLVDKSAIGFGKRSWRFSMLVDDGVVKKAFVEPEKPGDPFEVSDADTMLDYINPNARKPQAISMITKPGCPFCAKAKAMLTDRGMSFEEIVLGHDATLRSVRAITGKESVPQVFIEGEYIGGSEELATYLAGSEQDAA